MQCLEIPHLKLDMVANSGQCFRMKALDADTYRVLVGKKQVDITPLGDGRFQLSCEESETDGWRRYFDIETDYGPLLTELPLFGTVWSDCVNTSEQSCPKTSMPFPPLNSLPEQQNPSFAPVRWAIALPMCWERHGWSRPGRLI